MATIDADERREILRLMLLVRAFEDAVSEMARGDEPLPGMQILSTGQEAAVAAVRVLREDDVLVSNHRSHTHLLARQVDPGPLMAELMGKADGLNRGKSGTLHLVAPQVNVLMTSTVVGAGAPMAVGAAFAQQYRGEAALTMVFFGDGAAAEGSVHEAMNLASLWKLPVLFVCENNHWAGAQRLETHRAGGSMAARAAGYGMPGEVVDGNDADAVHEAAARLSVGARGGAGPALLELVTYRMHGHSESDPQRYVDQAELDAWRARDPIRLYTDRLLADGVVTAEGLAALRERAREVVASAVAFAEASPDPAPEGALDDVWSAATGVAPAPGEAAHA